MPIPAAGGEAAWGPIKQNQGANTTKKEASASLLVREISLCLVPFQLAEPNVTSLPSCNGTAKRWARTVGTVLAGQASLFRHHPCRATHLLWQRPPRDQGARLLTPGEGLELCPATPHGDPLPQAPDLCIAPLFIHSRLSPPLSGDQASNAPTRIRPRTCWMAASGSARISSTSSCQNRI